MTSVLPLRSRADPALSTHSLQLDKKHDELLSLEAEYEAQSRRNEQVIANLRRDLDKAREKLEQASHCDEVEAHQYLALLDGTAEINRSHRGRPRPVEMQPSFSRETEAAFESSVPPPVLQPRSPDRPRPGTKASHVTPVATPSAADRTEQRLRRLNERLADENRGAPPPSRLANPSSTSALAHQQIQQSGAQTKRPVGQAPQQEQVFDVLERSVWRDSTEASPGGRPKVKGNDLGRSGSKWSKIFPGAYGRKQQGV